MEQNTTIMTNTKPILTVTSPEFNYKGYIPSKYTCDGENINPPISIKDIPAGTKSLALICEDPDASEVFDYWLVWDIPPTEIIKENSVPGTLGRNSFGRNEYGGPCPPVGVHRYFFKIHALDTKLNLAEGSNKLKLQEAMTGHILSSGELIGLYRKMDKGEATD